ncbi:MAG: hypothetical protein ACOYO1_02780 [Bacteroidales bacterium]
MKNALFVIAGLIIIIWAILFKPAEVVHLLLLLAGSIILFTIIFDKKLSKK